MDKTIEYILEVARCGGIAKAARNLFITPSALSKFVIQREEELGVKLFAREGNKFTLTYPGERYVEMLREAQALNDRMNREMSRLADLYSGRLRIGFQMSFADLITTRILPIFQDEHPSIRVTMEEAGTGELMKLLKKNQLDVLLALTDVLPEDCRCDLILESPVVVAAAKGSPLQCLAAEREGFSFPWLPDEALWGEKIILDKGGRNFRRYADHLIDQRQKKLQSDITVSNARTALLCVEQDMGIIILPEVMVKLLQFEDRVELYSFGTQEKLSLLCGISDPKSVAADEVQTFLEISSKLIRQL